MRTKTVGREFNYLLFTFTFIYVGVCSIVTCGINVSGVIIMTEKRLLWLPCLQPLRKNDCDG